MALKQFSKILIFKNTPETRAAFGVNGNMDNWDGQSFAPSSDKQFNGTYPTENLSNFTSSFFENNLLHAIGTEEPIGAGATGLAGWNLDPQSSGKAYIIDGYIKAFNIDDYDGAVATFGNLADIESPTNGLEYVVANENRPYEYNSTTTSWEQGTIIPFTFNYPSDALVNNDMLFYGDDFNDLNIAGKITAVYNSGSVEYTQGKRYKLSKVNTPDTPYQDIYYYRNSWNGKGISIDVTEGFYILISVEKSNNQRILYPYLNVQGSSNSANSSTQIVVPSSGGTAYTDLIKLKRVSSKYKYDEDRISDEEQEIISCTIKRTNSVKSAIAIEVDQEDGEILLPAVFPTVNDFPYWVAYFVNPYGESSDVLLKNSVYAIEINELLPYYTIFSGAKVPGNYSNFFNRLV